MKKSLLLVGALLMGMVSTYAQKGGQIRVKSGYTADVVAESMPVEEYLVGGIDNGSVGLFTKTVPYVKNGLSSEMPLTSFENGNVYNIDYTKNNALRLVGPDDAADLGLPGGQMVTFANPVKTDKLWMLCICGNGPTDLYIEAMYDDDNIDYGTITVEDWWNSSENPDDHVGKDEAFWGLDRIDRNNNTPQGTKSVRILEKSISVNPEKNLVGVYIEKVDPAKGYPTIFGFSTGAEAIEVAEGFNADIVAEAMPIADHATVALDRNAWVLYSNDIENLVATTTYGLPDDGNIATNTGHTYFVDYASLNATRLISDDASTPDVDESTTTLVLEDKPTVTGNGELLFLGTAGNGPATLSVTFNYADGTTSTEEISIIDWCNHQSEAVVQTGRYYGGVDDRDYVGLYECSTLPDLDKQIVSITLTNISGGASKGIVLGLYLTEGSIGTAIDGVQAEAQKVDGKTYNLAGQQVNSSYKGIVIRNGKKMIVK